MIEKERLEPSEAGDEPEFNGLIEALCDAMEADDGATVEEKLDAMNKRLDRMEDKRFKGLYLSQRSVLQNSWKMQGTVNKIWNDHISQTSKIADQERLVKLLYAWFMHMKKVDSRFELPARAYGSSNYEYKKV